MSLSITELIWQAKPRGQTTPPHKKIMPTCRALALGIFVCFIILVRSGGDMGDLCVLSGLV